MLNRKYLPYVFIALFATVLFVGTNMQQTPQISQKEFLNLVQQPNSNIVLLDVRSKEEFEQGHISQAINIDYDDIEKKLALLEPYKQQTIVVYCRSGRRAGIAEKILINNGFTHVLHLTGDLLSWRDAKLPLVNVKPQKKHLKQVKQITKYQT